MPSAADFEREDQQPEALSPSCERAAAALDEILHLLDQMQMLAELSASDINVNRPLLQKRLEDLQKRIDRIADQLS